MTLSSSETWFKQGTPHEKPFNGEKWEKPQEVEKSLFQVGQRCNRCNLYNQIQ